MKKLWFVTNKNGQVDNSIAFYTLAAAQKEAEERARGAAVSAEFAVVEITQVVTASKAPVIWSSPVI